MSLDPCIFFGGVQVVVTMAIRPVRSPFGIANELRTTLTTVRCFDLPVELHKVAKPCELLIIGHFEQLDHLTTVKVPKTTIAKWAAGEIAVSLRHHATAPLRNVPALAAVTA